MMMKEQARINPSLSSADDKTECTSKVLGCSKDVGLAYFSALELSPYHHQGKNTTP